MEKIKLTDKCKDILRMLHEKKYSPIPDAEDQKALFLLREEGLIAANSYSSGEIYTCRISPKGEAYLYSNPKLKNPSIWDDKKYLITTAISVFALVISIIAIILQWKD